MQHPKVAIVTGAATGIGRACAERLARDGFSVVLNYRSRKAEMDTLVASLAGDHLTVQGDISEPEAASGLIEAAIAKYGRVDVLVNSAGVFEEHDVTSLDYEQWQASWTHTLQTNLTGPMNASFCAAKHMMKQRSGKIINITSRGAFRGEPNAPAYGASKSGLNSASQSLAKALGSYGIHVFAVAPGWVETPMVSTYLSGPSGDEIRQQTPLGRTARPEEIANVVSFLAADGSDYLTGSIIDVNGASYLRN
jgi:NAD(P)-dependent dehydrogenase (short-subunit alcohol dehydrogenase family)